MPDQQRINGAQFSWSSIYFKLGGERYYGVKSITYGDNLEIAKGYGLGRHHAPTSRTAGKYVPDPVGVVLRKDTARAMRQKLAQLAGGTSFGHVEFQTIVQYVETGLAGITDTINGCRWRKNSSKNEEGAEGLYEETEFDCMHILWNGLALFNNREGNP